jgi:hypothetical protein
MHGDAMLHVGQREGEVLPDTLTYETGAKREMYGSLAHNPNTHRFEPGPEASFSQPRCSSLTSLESVMNSDVEMPD